MSTVFVVGSGSEISKKRQSRAKLLNVGDKVRIVREPKNQYDANAIRVTTLKTENSGYETIGFIPKQFSHLLTDIMIESKKKTMTVPVSIVSINSKGDTNISLRVPKLW